MILVCAATNTEARAARRGIADAARGRGGHLDARPGTVEMLVTGVGPRRAADALRRRLAAEASVRPERSAAESKGEAVTLAVSTGFAGALSPGVDPLSWVTARAVHGLAGGRLERVAIADGLLRLADAALPCAVVSADHVLHEAPDGLAPPVAADMESAALAEVAAEAGIPFLVLRLVTDTPDRALPPVAGALAGAFAAEGLSRTLAHGVRAALDAAREPRRTAAFLRDTAAWCDALRAGWCERMGGIAAAAAASR